MRKRAREWKHYKSSDVEIVSSNDPLVAGEWNQSYLVQPG